MRLPVAQRSSVILMDVLGYSLGEVSNILDNGIPAVKAALHRGRVRLREIAQEPDDSPLPVLADSERALLAAYVARFNARDFDTIRTMLADEVRLDLVTKLRRSGRSEVTNYFSRYSEIDDWHFVPGLVERRPAVIVRDPRTASRTPSYFILLEWAGDRLVNIRDFRFARYATEGAELFVME
jgi:RNA polymerase sigma-70 factor (ECF subfamily)